MPPHLKAQREAVNANRRLQRPCGTSTACIERIFTRRDEMHDTDVLLWADQLAVRLRQFVRSREHLFGRKGIVIPEYFNERQSRAT